MSHVTPLASDPPQSPKSRRRLILRGLIPLVGISLIIGLWWIRGQQQTEGWDSSDPGSRSSLAKKVVAQLPQSSGSFDLRNVRVPAGEIRSGGPPKDGIPAVSQPKFTTARQASFLQPRDRVIGVTDGEIARAYPLRILNYHEIVNDRFGDVPIAVTYCPLCDSAVVFDRRTPLGEREFGVSGLLYNSNVLMYDRGGQPESLWSQIMTTGISGAGADQPLATLPLQLTTWEDWASRYPNTLVLSDQTGFSRDYSRSAYSAYFQTDRLMFPVNHHDNRLPPKVPVLGVWTERGGAKAYPVSSFSTTRQQIDDQIDGLSLTISFNPEAKSLRVVEAEEGVHWMYALWFAWAAMQRDTLVDLPTTR